MVLCQQTDLNSLNYKGKINMYMVLCKVNIKRIKLYNNCMWALQTFLYSTMCKKVVNTIHSLTHLGEKPTLTAVSNGFVRPCMNKDITAGAIYAWTVIRARSANLLTLTPLQNFEEQDCHFDHLHIEIVGPSQRFTYLFTIINRFILWTDTVLMTDSIAPTCARVLLHYWISRFSVPGKTTLEHGPQFTS